MKKICTFTTYITMEQKILNAIMVFLVLLIIGLTAAVALGAPLGAAKRPDNRRDD